MSSQQRLAMIDAVAPTVVCCTPTYALRLAEVDAEQAAGRRPLSESTVRAVIVAGEPGGKHSGHARADRTRWGARVIDQHGLTEVGPVSFECWESPGALHVNENEFICEVVDPSTLEPVADGPPASCCSPISAGPASPVIRYRTGDVVVRRVGAVRVRPDVRPARRRHHRAHRRHGEHPRRQRVSGRHRVGPAPLRGGRRVPIDGVAGSGALRSLAVEVELAPSVADPRTITTGVTQKLREALGLTVPVQIVAPGTLPRFEMKARRFVVEP